MFHKAGGRRIKVRLPTPKTVSPHFSITNTLSACFSVVHYRKNTNTFSYCRRERVGSGFRRQETAGVNKATSRPSSFITP